MSVLQKGAFALVVGGMVATELVRGVVNAVRGHNRASSILTQYMGTAQADCVQIPARLEVIGDDEVQFLDLGQLVSKDELKSLNNYVHRLTDIVVGLQEARPGDPTSILEVLTSEGEGTYTIEARGGANAIVSSFYRNEHGVVFQEYNSLKFMPWESIRSISRRLTKAS